MVCESYFIILTAHTHDECSQTTYCPVWGSPQLLFDLHMWIKASTVVEIITQKTYVLLLDFSQTSYTPDQRTDVKVPYSTKLWQ